MPNFRPPRGLSLIELLIGLAIGMFIVAGATAMLLVNLRETRQVLLEARLTHDLGSAADLMARDLRRAGHWSGALQGMVPAADLAFTPNPYATPGPGPAAADQVLYGYALGTHEDGTTGANERFGFRLRAGVIEMQLGEGNWQALTDIATLRVTRLLLEPAVERVALAAYCALTCETRAAGCPPEQRATRYSIQLEAHLAADPGVVRTVNRSVRVRNEVVGGECAP